METESNMQLPMDSIKAINVVDLSPNQSLNVYIEMLSMVISQLETMTGVNKRDKDRVRHHKQQQE
jgi:hypothetical protein